MSTEPISFEVGNDGDLIKYVRLITGYQDTPNELPADELRGHIGMMKGRLATEYDLTLGNEPWFSDNALGLSLMYATAIHSKVTIENYSVAQWDFGDEQITTHSNSSESAQLNMWLQWMNDALDNSDAIDGDVKPRIAADFNFSGGKPDYFERRRYY